MIMFYYRLTRMGPYDLGPLEGKAYNATLPVRYS